MSSLSYCFMRIGNFVNRFLPCAVLVAGALALASPSAQAREPLSVYTGAWPPFVRAPDQPAGSAAEVVRMVLHNMDRDVGFEHFGYAYGYLAIKKGTVPAAFPFFKTRARLDEVLFSRPLFTVRNAVYYNLQFRDFDNEPVDPSTLRVGRVNGYSYGDGLDAALESCPTSDSERCPVFDSETEAVRSLLNDRIDLLPMTDSVAAAILADSFPDESQLLRQVPGDAFASTSTLHLIAPRNDDGQALITAFNASHEELLAAGVITAADRGLAQTTARGANVVRISASEGFPIVVGVDDQNPEKFYAVPEGTRALVLEWSDKISAPSTDDRLYAVMVDQSLVVILDGPHVGKELRIRNMHLSITQ